MQNVVLMLLLHQFAVLNYVLKPKGANRQFKLLVEHADFCSNVVAKSIRLFLNSIYGE